MIFILLGLILFIYMNFWFLVSVFTKKNDVADVAWGLGFVMLAWVSLLINESYSIVAIVTTGLVTIWGLRLAYHIYSRNKGKPEDYRYAAWRAEWGKWFYLRSYFQIYILQGFLLFLISLPVIFINIYCIENFGVLAAIGILVWLTGFFFESVGDAQLAKFIKNPKNKGKLMQSGLWKYTRHPNYFGEVTQWWGIFIIALTVPYGFLSIIGPLTITFLILKVSGVPMLEKKMELNPDFAEYKKRTSMFMPLPPRGDVEINLNPIFSRRLGLNLFIEFGPIISFFVIFSFFDFIVATLALVVIAFFAFCLSVFVEKRVAVFSLCASGSIVVFGGATVLFKDPTFIIFKDTLFWGILGMIITLYYIRGTLILKKLFISIFDITDKGWEIVSIRWAVFAFCLAISNQIALMYFTPMQWVYYKMFTLGALVLFSLWQFVLSSKERNPNANPWGMRI